VVICEARCTEQKNNEEIETEVYVCSQLNPGEFSPLHTDGQ